MLRHFLKKTPTRAPRVPADVRVYAIGDIHGCDDLFARLLLLISADHAARAPKRKILIALGDLVNRGPDSASVVARACKLAEEQQDVHFLAGNHEELLIKTCDGSIEAARTLNRSGGRATALSYGINIEDYDASNFLGQIALFNSAVPMRHLEFLRCMEDTFVLGDYAFVHAGIRPNFPLMKQATNDLRWIREPFLTHRGHHEKFIVHGHTITPEIDEHPNRLGIDTGAYASGKLTAVALEDSQRWFLQT